MNIQGSINKLLLALKLQDKFYKINSYRFFSKSNQKYCTKYSLLERRIEETINEETLEVEYKEKYREELSTYSQVEILKYLVEEYKKGSEASE